MHNIHSLLVLPIKGSFPYRALLTTCLGVQNSIVPKYGIIFFSKGLILLSFLNRIDDDDGAYK